MKKENNIIYFTFLLIICYLKKIIFSSQTKIENYLFNEKWAKNIFRKVNITSLIMDDSYYFNFSRPKSLIEICKLNNIKIILIHLSYVYKKEDLDNLKSKKLENFYPKIIVTSNKMKQILNSCGTNQTKIVNPGSARFSSENLNL